MKPIKENTERLLRLLDEFGKIGWIPDSVGAYNCWRTSIVMTGIITPEIIKYLQSNGYEKTISQDPDDITYKKEDGEYIVLTKGHIIWNY